jgi:hypothetical protein
MRRSRNQHEWGIVAQCKEPYREFEYCPLCCQFKEGNWIFNRRTFIALSAELRQDNPMFEPDSDHLLVHQSNWRE